MKRRIHFYQAFSRIGLQNPPNHSITPNFGVESAPRFILNGKFVSQFNHQVNQFHFIDPQKLDSAEFRTQLADQIQSFRQLIVSTLQKGQTAVVLGGDNTVTLPSVLAQLDLLAPNKQLLFVDFDSHGDCNLRKLSPSDNFHGMYLRPLYSDDFDISEISAIVDHHLPASQIVYFGNLDLDGDEPDFFRRKHIQNFTSHDLSESIKSVKNFLAQFSPDSTHVHVNFDIDCLDHTLAPATGIPARQGLTFEQITPILRQLAIFPDLSIDLVEYNPTLPGADITLKNIHQVLSLLLQP